MKDRVTLLGLVMIGLCVFLSPFVTVDAAEREVIETQLGQNVSFDLHADTGGVEVSEVTLVFETLQTELPVMKFGAAGIGVTGGKVTSGTTPVKGSEFTELPDGRRGAVNVLLTVTWKPNGAPKALNARLGYVELSPAVATSEKNALGMHWRAAYAITADGRRFELSRQDLPRFRVKGYDGFYLLSFERQPRAWGDGGREAS